MPTPSHADHLEELRRRVNKRLSELAVEVAGRDAGLSDAISSSLTAGGKRLRPLLTALVCEDLGGPLAPAIDAGCAAEMVHTASLILDDLPCMDDAQMRRGQPTTHRAFGEDVAILAAIALLSGAFSTISTLRGTDAVTRNELTKILSGAVGTRGLVAGQFRDLRNAAGNKGADPEAVNALKTGALIGASVAMGAAIARADTMRKRALADFAEHLGHAFQLYDDLLDTSGDPLVIGKDIGKDGAKATLLQQEGAAGTQVRLNQHLDAAHATLESVFGRDCRMSSALDGVFQGQAALIVRTRRTQGVSLS